jgi:hypothetical protein
VVVRKAKGMIYEDIEEARAKCAAREGATCGRGKTWSEAQDLCVRDRADVPEQRVSEAWMIWHEFYDHALKDAWARY